MSIDSRFTARGYEFEDFGTLMPDTDALLNEATEARRMSIEGRTGDASSTALEALNNVFKAFNTLTGMSTQENNPVGAEHDSDRTLTHDDERNDLADKDDAENNREQDEEKTTVESDAGGKQDTGVCSRSGVKSNNTEETSESVAEDQPDKSYDDAIKKVLRRIEQTYGASSPIRPLDNGQMEYLDKLKGVISRFKSITELLSSCYEFATKGQGHLDPSDVVFQLILFLSDEPERYIKLFALNPLSYYENPLDMKRLYAYDDFIRFVEDKV